MRQGVWAALLAGLAPAAASAGDLQGWHIMEALVRPTSRLEVIVQSRIQTRDRLHTLQQIRLGPTVRLLAHPRLIPFFSLYYPLDEPYPDRLHAGPRLIAGVETPWRFRRALVLTTRLGMDRTFPTVRPAFNRYRTFARLTWNRRLSPLLQNEVLTVRQGFHSTRTGAGFRWRILAHATLDAAYFYDVRAAEWGGSRAWILTTLRFHPASRNR